MPAPMRPSPTIPICISAPRTCESILGSQTHHGYRRLAAMACHADHGERRLARGFALRSAARRRLLVLPCEQRALGDVGLARPCLCAGRPAVLPRRDEYPRRLQERMKELLCRLEIAEAAQPGELPLGELASGGDRLRAHLRRAELAFEMQPRLSITDSAHAGQVGAERVAIA